MIGSPLAARSRAPAILFWVTAVGVLFWSLGSRALWSAEGRWAEVAREMMLRGDYFHPLINGQPYFDKPLLGYWLVIAASFLTGTLNEWAVRLPAAMAGLVALWSIRELGRTLWSQRTGYWAGWMLLASVGFLLWGRTGAAEIENMATITLAVAWYFKRREEPGFTLWAVFYAICFLGSQTKGLTAVVAPVLVIAPDMLRAGRWKKLFSPAHFAGVSIGLLIYAAPFALAAATNHGYAENGFSLAFRENVLRYFQPFDHRESPAVYLASLPEYLLPWTPLFLGATAWIALGWKQRTKAEKNMALAALFIFLFFSFSGSRRSYYILPILPFCVLLSTAFLCDRERSRLKRWTLRAQWAVLLLVAAVEIVVPLVARPISDRLGFAPPSGLAPLTAAIGLLAVGAAAVFPRRSGEDRQPASLIAVAVILMAGAFCVQLTVLDDFRTIRPFAMALRARLRADPDCEVLYLHDSNTDILFYMNQRRNARVFVEKGDLQRYLATKGRPGLLLAQRKSLGELRSLFRNQLPEKPVERQEVSPGDRDVDGKWLAFMVKR